MKDIVKRICNIQIEALNRIITKYEVTDDSDLDEPLLTDLFQITVKPDDIKYLRALIKNSANDVINFYKEVRQNPSLLSMANEYQLLLCSHILFKMEDQWINDNPYGVYDTWKLIHKAMVKFHPEYTLII